MVVVDVQRAGPSTGMPTKTEAADLLMALYGRHGESPLPVVAASTPARLLRHRDRGRPHRGHPPHPGDPAGRHLPRELLRALAAARRGAAARHRPELRHRAERRRRVHALPARRQPGPPVGDPGTPGLRHRIGGLEKEDGTGNISYEPENHEHMTRLRAERVARGGPGPRGRRSRRRRRAARARLGLELRRDPGRGAPPAAREGAKVATAHIRHLNPLPRNTGEVLRAYERVLVPEMNMGQLVKSCAPSSSSTSRATRRSRACRSSRAT